MREISVDAELIAEVFDLSRGPIFTLASCVDGGRISDDLALVLRRCYVGDAKVADRISATGLTEEEVVRSFLPDAGSTMSGDFGEFVGTVLHALLEGGADGLVVAKKWRLKENRRRPSSGTDIVIFQVPEWPAFSDRDRLLSAEVKTKATSGGSDPVCEALADVRKDRSSRLSKTLVWLRERALQEDLGDVTVALTNRFLNAIGGPPPVRVHRAIAVVCDSLASAALDSVPLTNPLPCDELLVVRLPDLQAVYEATFERAAMGRTT